MKVSFDNVFDKTKMIRDISKSLFASYKKSDWDDDVHSSYEKYLRQCEVFYTKLCDYCSILKRVEVDLASLVDSGKIRNELQKYEMELKSI